MASASLQAKANELNLRMEGEARKVMDGVESRLLRPIARGSYACVVSCYDKAGAKGSTDILERCSKECQVPYQRAHAVVQQEVNQFQNRLNRAMQQCNDEASAMMLPGTRDDPKEMAKVEDTILKCMSGVVSDHTKQLKPMRERIDGHLKETLKN
mmetsp:Transcript_15169/g.20695  ORF Transcript_15169/g.20695 Transcript_15169/m.20695 type:complete len:155 (-) Transcript_15169:363-827(-)|eukprot:CAMPEP_0185728968 /NCGR_PEP_ID=MMETSP1171-20130828/4395_1 /TAXON_ID=374046 /ORGANISM="Helicotheca tamensis, Strain CCMP826" /LENGTH=154 /DNA_ID=CAMNT_0028397731 /DNA_START=56 /DNA_END=520 /DNA_ORIENTATION=+